MPRRPRISYAGVTHHVIQRGNNRQPCFINDDDRRVFLKWLADYAAQFGCKIHAYVLMTNHIHLLVTPASAAGLAMMMQRLGQRYVQYFNRVHDRSGTLWDGRFRSCLVDGDLYVLTCYRYIELNPVRAGMVNRPAEYRWSSHDTNAYGCPDALVSSHVSYLALGDTPSERRQSYRRLFERELHGKRLDEIRQATNGNFALGDERFLDDLSMTLGVRITPGKNGRPAGRRKKR